MAKGDFWFKFEWNAWLGDDSLSLCSLETQGFWIRCIAIMNRSSVSELTGTQSQLCRQIGCLPDEFDRSCNELKNTNSADVIFGNDFVMLLSRRRKRELKLHESNRLAVERYREKERCNGDVRGQSKNKSKSKKESNLILNSIVVGETASPAASTAKTKKPKLSDAEWLESLQAKPAYESLGVLIEYSRAEAWAEVNQRKCTRRFFVNWLNRAKPMEVNGNGSIQRLNGNGYKSEREKSADRGENAIAMVAELRRRGEQQKLELSRGSNGHSEGNLIVIESAEPD